MKSFLMIVIVLMVGITAAAIEPSSQILKIKANRQTAESKGLEPQAAAKFSSSKMQSLRSEKPELNQNSKSSLKNEDDPRSSSSMKSLSFDGQDKGNGGFLFSRTSKKLLDTAQASLLSEIKSLLSSREQIVYASGTCATPIDMKQFENAVSDISYTYEKGTYAVNEEGREEERYFQINRDGKVEATALYFNSFVDTYFRYIEAVDLNKKDAILEPVRVAIIHEALHLFGYNQAKAEACSQDLAKVIASYNDGKLKRLQETLTLENDALVKENLISHQCLDASTLQAAHMVGYKYVYSPIYFQQVAQRVLKCMSQNFASLKKEDVSMDSAEIFLRLAKIISANQNMEETTRQINQLIHFPFEKPIPTQM